MKNKKAIEVSKRIDAYIHGKLSQSEIDELWLIFLKNPHYYELFETELQLRNLIQKEKYSGGLITEKSDRTKRFIYWTLAAAACVLIVFAIQIYFPDCDPDFESLALNSIAYKEMAAGNVERSNDATVINVETEINHAMASAYMSREGEVIRMFKDLQASAVDESQKSRIELNLAIFITINLNLR